MSIKNYMAGAAMLLALAVGGVQAQEERPRTLDELLRLVEQGRARDNTEATAREREFQQQQAEQDRLLQEANARQAAEEARSQELETRFEENELLIADVRGQLDVRLGSLRELFGVLQQVSGDTRGQFEASLTNVEYPDRSQFLTDLAAKMGQSSRLASIEEIERLWFEIQREATELGKVKRLPGFTFTTATGEEVMQDVIRVGAFNLVADGRYLNHNTATNTVSELQRQPSQGRFINSTTALVNAQAGDGMVRFGLDPSRGQILSLLIATPNLRERVNQGGLVGYVILSLGAVGVLLALERLITLTFASRKVKAQLKRDTPSTDNALGRVLAVYHANRQVDTETLELKLGEAILKEQPALQRGILFIKIISVVAPLLGLLGTVTGMVAVFDVMAITNGADAKAMSAGVSRATIPTMAGMVASLSGIMFTSGMDRRVNHSVQWVEDEMEIG